MEENKRTCFIISSLGSLNSSTRERSNVIDSIEIALEKYNFIVTRADETGGTNPITNDIIYQIQNSDLCIIDLTGKDPNVMYEFGRRHENGKPLILIVSKEEELPFDVSGIRTIFYDIKDRDVFINIVKQIQSFIDNVISNNFPSAPSYDKLSSIITRLERIEQNISRLFAKSTSLSSSGSSDAIAESDQLADLSLTQRFAFFLRTNDIANAEKLLPAIQQTTNEDVFYDRILEPLAQLGSSKAIEILTDNIDYIDNLTEERKIEAITYLSRGYQKKDREKGLEVLGPFIDKYIPICKSNENKATLINQKARLTTNNKERIILSEQAIKLNPDPAFYYNLSGFYQTEGNINKAREAIDSCLKLVKEKDKEMDPDFINQAIDVYVQLKDKEKVLELLSILKDINLPLYELARTDRDVMKLIKNK